MQPRGRALQAAGAAGAKALRQTGRRAVHGQRGDPCGWSPGGEGLRQVLGDIVDPSKEQVLF